jgi:hypothetical protein
MEDAPSAAVMVKAYPKLGGETPFEGLEEEEE